MLCDISGMNLKSGMGNCNSMGSYSFCQQICRHVVLIIIRLNWEESSSKDSKCNGFMVIHFLLDVIWMTSIDVMLHIEWKKCDFAFQHRETISQAWYIRLIARFAFNSNLYSVHIKCRFHTFQSFGITLYSFNREVTQLNHQINIFMYDVGFRNVLSKKYLCSNRHF